MIVGLQSEMKLDPGTLKSQPHHKGKRYRGGCGGHDANEAYSHVPFDPKPYMKQITADGPSTSRTEGCCYNLNSNDAVC